jgi:hypothetical protein
LFGRAYLIKHTIYGRLNNMASEIVIMGTGQPIIKINISHKA